MNAENGPEHLRTLDGEQLEWRRQEAIEAGDEEALDAIQDIMQDPGVFPRKKT
jgi:hypothetical protein